MKCNFLVSAKWTNSENTEVDKINCFLLCPIVFQYVFIVNCVFACFTGVIEVLVNSGRQIDAVNLAFAFELTQQFSPVPLLKSYLKEARKASSPIKTGNSSPTAQVCFLNCIILNKLILISFF